MARKVSVEIVGDAASLEKAFGRAKSSAQNFESGIGKAARGATAATVSFHGLGRSIAFASSAFIGTAGLTALIKDSLEAAETSAKAHASLATALDKVGAVSKQQLPIVNAWAEQQARFGVSANAAVTGLGRLVELTGSTRKAMEGYTAALEISKATGKDLGTVSLAVGKALNGQTTALARYIGKIPKGTSNLELLTEVSKKYGGQAQANTVATDRLGAEVSNLETVIGTALLPTVDKLATKLANWLGNSQNQARVQRDVTKAVSDATTAFNQAKGAVEEVDNVTGSFAHTLELLLGLKVAATVAGWTGAFAKLASASGGIGAAASESGLLLTNMRALSTLGPIGLTVAVAIEDVKNPKSILGRFNTLKNLSPTVVDALKNNPATSGLGAVVDLLQVGSKAVGGKKPAGGGNPKLVLGDHSDTSLRRGSVANINTPVLAAPSAPSTPSLSALQKINLALAKNPNDKAAINAKLTVDIKAAAFAKKLIDSGQLSSKNLAKRYQQLVSIYGDEASLRSQLASLDKKNESAKDDAHKKELAALKKEREAAAARAASLKAALAQAVSQAFSAIGDLGQGPVATGPQAQFLQQFGGSLSAAGFVSDIKAQNDAFAKELRNVATLKNRGAPKQLLKTLFSQGQSGAQEIAALSSASPGQLKTFFAQYQRRQNLVTQAVRMDVTTPSVNITARTVSVQPQTGTPSANKFGRVGSSGRRK